MEIILEIRDYLLPDKDSIKHIHAMVVYEFKLLYAAKYFWSYNWRHNFDTFSYVHCLASCGCDPQAVVIHNDKGGWHQDFRFVFQTFNSGKIIQGKLKSSTLEKDPFEILKKAKTIKSRRHSSILIPGTVTVFGYTTVNKSING